MDNKSPSYEYECEDDYFKQSFSNQDSMNTSESPVLSLTLSAEVTPILPSLPHTKNYKFSDFNVLKLLGEGRYSKVYLVVHKETNTKYAMKVEQKKILIKSNATYRPYIEAEILGSLDHTNIIKFYGVFEDSESIYILLEYCSEGTFQEFIEKNYPIKFYTAQYYAAQLVNFLEYLQKNNIVHRDLKPENILLNEDFVIKVVDFGTAKVLGKAFDKTKMTFKDEETTEKAKPKGNTFVGTIDFMSPEMINNNGEQSFGVDLWALGCILYMMFNKNSPFQDETEYLTYQNILGNKLDFGNSFPSDAKDLVKKLLLIDHRKRLGASSQSGNDINALKKHSFFKFFDFVNVINTSSHTDNYETDSLKQSCKEVVKTREDTSPSKIKEGQVMIKSNFLFHTTRKLKLYNNCVLVIQDNDTNALIDQIKLCKNSVAMSKETSKFDVVTQEDIYTFKTSEPSEAEDWITLINLIIHKFFETTTD